MTCDECGAEFWIDLDGISHHWGQGTDLIDHDADANHVAYTREGNER